MEADREIAKRRRNGREFSQERLDCRAILETEYRQAVEAVRLTA